MGQYTKMHKKIETIIFDMDGLMFDTEHLSRIIWIKLFNKLNYPVKEEFFQLITGSNIHDSIDYFNKCYPTSKYSFVELKDIKNKEMVEYILKNGAPIKKGLFELLKYLKENNYNILLATSTSKKQALTILNKADVTSYFDNMIFGDEVINSKPHITITFSYSMSLKPKNFSIQNSVAGIVSEQFYDMKRMDSILVYMQHIPHGDGSLKKYKIFH